MAKAKKPAAAIPQHDYILIDRSGSMATRWSDTLGGVNAYAQGLAKDKATKDILLTVAVFDTQGPFDVIRKDVPATQWRDIHDGEASPRGGTPLYDGVGRLVTVAEKDAPEKSAIVIVTDGEENSSHEHTKESVKAVLDRCRARGWQVIFLGADFDNFSQGVGLGNSIGQTMAMASVNMKKGLAETATMRSAYSATGATMNYSAEQRARFGSPDPKASAHGRPVAR